MASIAQFGVQDRQLTDKERWLSFFVLFLFAFVAAFNLFKAAPALQFIGLDFGLDASGIGYIMSAYSISVVVLAYPGMIIMQKVGVKTSIVGASIIMLIGTLCGTVSTSSAFFMFSRIIEGAAYGAMHVMCPNVMPRLFPQAKQGLAMGIFSQCVPVGTIIAFFAAPVVFNAVGWRPIWFISIVMEFVAIIGILALVKMPKIPENELIDSDPAKRKKPGRNYIFAAVLMAVVFSVWVYDYVVNVNTLYPTFLQQAKGLSIFASSMLPNVTAFISIPLGIIAGVVTEKLNCRKTAVIAGYLLLAVIMFFCAYTPGDDMIGPWVFSILLGFCQGCCVTCTRAGIPVLAPEPKKTDLALATMSFFTGVAMCLGGVASNSVVAIGWIANGRYILAPAALAAAVLVLAFVKSDRKVAAIRREEASQGDSETRAAGTSQVSRAHV